MQKRLFLAVVLSASSSLASDWTRFRGPNGDGVSEDAGLPAEIGPDRGVSWKVDVPEGNSSPIVIEGRLFLTGAEGEERVVLCHDASTGERLWRRSFPRGRAEIFNPMNGPATPTPVSSGRRVVVFFPEIGLIALSFDGDELWRTLLGPFASVQGLASSPVYLDGRIFLLVDTPEEAYLAAFDTVTGRPLWKSQRPTGVLGSYATPTSHVPARGKPQVIVAGARELTGYDAATGERLWWAPGVTSFPSAPPFVAGDSVYTVEPGGGVSWPPFQEPLGLFDLDKNGRIEIKEAASDEIWARSLLGIDKNLGNDDGVVDGEEYATANGAEADGGLVRTRLGGGGEVLRSHVLWRQAKGMPALTGALLYRGVLYVVRNAIVSTFDPETGRSLRQERLKDALGEYYASPVAGDGKIYLASLEGTVSVLEAGADWRVLSTGDLGERIIATPAIANGLVFIRAGRTLYAFGR